jgi:hypothetical protein
MSMNTFTEAHTSVYNEPTASNGMVHLVVSDLRKGLALVRRTRTIRVRKDKKWRKLLPCGPYKQRAGTPRPK